MPRLLLVDDEPSQLKALQRTLRGLCPDLHMDLALGGEEALTHLRARAHDAILADLRMPGMDGLTLLGQAARWQPLAVPMLLTGVADFATAQRALNETGIFRYLTKPWEPELLRAHVCAALAEFQHRVTQQTQAAAWQAEQGVLSPQELERLRLEREEPGLTHVEWADDGAVLMPALDAHLPSMPR
ncbi:response regulator [Ideonella oryzae]|uniref:Response regulator n=1 Tax=Ideonella oryzae TaxID=2937441 RepID=A0ABT1BL89_9BURK|nr:response regulator [Ideonella oryzae]MCO5976346.1 response regulator [Ideonella oryzae]